MSKLLRKYLGTTPENPKRAMYPGAVGLALVNGSVFMQAAVGDAVRYGAGPVELAVSRRVPMRQRTW